MGMGPTQQGQQPDPTQGMPGQPDQLDAMVKARKAALLTLRMRRGLQSTFLTTPAPGAPAGSTILGGGTIGGGG